MSNVNQYFISKHLRLSSFLIYSVGISATNVVDNSFFMIFGFDIKSIYEDFKPF